MSTYPAELIPLPSQTRYHDRLHSANPIWCYFELDIQNNFASITPQSSTASYCFHPPLTNMSATLKHEHLGELKGNSVDGAVQFLGLKYATLKNRLATAELVDSYGSGITDATRYGSVSRTYCLARTNVVQATPNITSRRYQ
jgi:hypothetical protein